MIRFVLGLLLSAGLFLGCQPTAAASPSPSYCDGITSEIGGCDPGRPTFIRTTCVAIAREFGSQLDQRLVAIYLGPESKDESKAVRASAATALTVGLVNLHLRRAGLIKTCSAPSFLDDAEKTFSPTLMAHAGEILDDGPPVTYVKWRASLLGFLALIDQEEDAPTP